MSSPNILPNIRTSCGQPNSFNVVAAANSLGRSVRPHYATSVIDGLQQRQVTLPSCVCQNSVNDVSCLMLCGCECSCIVDCRVSIYGMPPEIVPGNASGIYPGGGRRSSLRRISGSPDRYQAENHRVALWRSEPRNGRSEAWCFGFRCRYSERLLDGERVIT